MPSASIIDDILSFLSIVLPHSIDRPRSKFLRGLGCVLMIALLSAGIAFSVYIIVY